MNPLDEAGEPRPAAERRTASRDLVAELPVPVNRDVLADEVAAAALAVPGVVALHTGTFGEVATYLAGRRVDGVQLRPDSCAVHLVLAWDAPLLATADRVRAAVEQLVGAPVDISIEDVLGPAGPNAENIGTRGMA